MGAVAAWHFHLRNYVFSEMLRFFNMPPAICAVQARSTSVRSARSLRQPKASTLAGIMKTSSQTDLE